MSGKKVTNLVIMAVMAFGLTDQLGQGLSSEDLKQTLDQAEFLACTLQGRPWDVVKETCN